MGPTLARMAKRAAPGKRVIGVARFSEPRLQRVARTPRHRMHRLRPARPRGAASACPTWATACATSCSWPATSSARDRQRVADLGDERRRAGDGGRDVHASRASWCSRPPASIRSCRWTARARTSRCPPRRRPATTPTPASAASACSSTARAQHGTPGRLVRLSYAIDMRYGVLHDVASERVRRPADRPDDGPRQRHLAGRCQRAGAAPARALHGADLAAQRHRAAPHRQRALAGRRVRPALRQEPIFTGTEAPTAWLVDTHAGAARCSARRACRSATMIDWVADWVRARRAEPGQADALLDARWQVLKLARRQPRADSTWPTWPARSRCRRRRTGTRTRPTGERCWRSVAAWGIEPTLPTAAGSSPRRR